MPFAFAIVFLALVSEAHVLQRSPNAQNDITKENNCGLKRGVMNIYIPGCKRRTIRSVGCKGLCLSSARPGLSDQMKTSNEFFTVCKCCKPKTARSRNLKLQCPLHIVKERRIRIYEATSCACLPCSTS